MENINTQKSATVPDPNMSNNSLEEIGFFFLLKTSFQTFIRNWLNYIKLTFTLIVPIVIIGVLLFWYLGNSAKAAPKIPDRPVGTGVSTEESISFSADNTAPDEMATPPDENTVSATEESVAGESDGITETTPLDTGIANYETVMPTDAYETTIVTDMPVPTLYNTGTFEVSETSGALEGLFTGGIFRSLLGIFTGVFLIIMLILILPFILYRIFVVLAHVRLTVLVTQEEEIKIGEILKWSLRKIGPFIMLSVRIFIYVAWPLLLMPVLLLLPLIGVKTGIMVFISSLVGFAGMIYMIIKGPRCVFAQYALAEKECSSKEALRNSIEASKGHWWKIISYFFFLSMLIGVVSPLLMNILGKIHELVGIIVSSLIALMGIYITMIFVYGLYNLCKMLNSAKQA